MTKYTIYGAGRLGIAAMNHILTADFKGFGEIVMFSPHNHKRVHGALQDLKDASSLLKRVPSWQFTPSGDTASLNDSDVVFLCAGGSPTAEEYAIGAQNGIDDRMVQAQKNISIVKNFCATVRRHCPKAKIFVISNPVDMLTDIARHELPENEVYGLGCFLDTARFRHILWQELQSRGYQTPYSSICAWILGHHCETMFLHQASFYFEGIDQCPELEDIVASALQKTRGRGLEITTLNITESTKDLNNGAFYAPALMISEVIKAFEGHNKLELPLNRPITKEDNLDLEGKSAQLLATVYNKKISPKILKFSLSDQQLLQTSINRCEQNKQNFIRKYPLK